jgi:hypothetical protein
MMNDKFEQISMELVNKTNELYYIQAALNNLELVKKAQVSQGEAAWGYFTSNAIHEFMARATDLQKKINELNEEQKELYKNQRAESLAT